MASKKKAVKKRSHAPASRVEVQNMVDALKDLFDERREADEKFFNEKFANVDRRLEGIETRLDKADEERRGYELKYEQEKLEQCKTCDAKHNAVDEKIGTMRTFLKSVAAISAAIGALIGTIGASIVHWLVNNFKGVHP